MQHLETVERNAWNDACKGQCPVMKRFLPLAAFVPLCFLLLPLDARAEAPTARDDAAGSVGPSVAVMPVLAAIKGDGGGYDPYAGFALAPSYRFTPRFSLGLITSFAWGPETVVADHFALGGGSYDLNRRMLRVAGEARHHLALGSSTDWWLAGELGVADEIYVTNTDSEHHTAPLAGVGTGIDFHLARSVFVGFDARAQLMRFTGGVMQDAPPTPSGLLSAFYGGLVLGLHLPSDG
jgi:hypothetical protein